MLNFIKNSRRNKPLLLAIALLGATVIALSFSVNSNANSIYETGVNEDGLTYGSAASALTPEEEPDLIQVEATNGKTGYVLKKELSIAEGDYVDNPTEAIEYMKEKNRKSAEAFTNYMREVLRENIILDEEQYQEAKESFYLNGESVQEVLLQIGIDPSGNNVSEEELRNAFNEADNANAQSINVYEKDGKTKIGVFIIN